MKKHILLLLVLLGISCRVFSWVGSNISVGISYPPNDTYTTISVPFSVFGWCWNEEQGIYYYQIEQIYDKNENGIIDQTEFDNRTMVFRQYAFNQIGKTNNRLTPRNIVSGGQGRKYFLFIFAVDLNGDVSWDTNIVGLGRYGDSTRPGSCIIYYTVSGVRP